MMDLRGMSFVVGSYRYTRSDEGWTMTHKDYDYKTPVSWHHTVELVQRIGELMKEVEGLRMVAHKDMEKTLKRISAGCLVCGAMSWKPTGTGEMACDDCGNVFDAPFVRERIPDADAGGDK